MGVLSSLSRARGENIAISRPFSSFVSCFSVYLSFFPVLTFFSGPLVAQRDSPERAAHQLSRTLRPVRLFLAGEEFSPCSKQTDVVLKNARTAVAVVVNKGYIVLLLLCVTVGCWYWQQRKVGPVVLLL